MKKNVSILLFLFVLIPLSFSVQSCAENDIFENMTSGGALPDDDPRSDIDSVSSWRHYDYVYKPDVVEISDAQLNALIIDTEFGVILPGVSSIKFEPDIDRSLIPNVGEILLCNTDKPQTPFGIAGRVTSITHGANSIEVKLAPVELTDVYEYLDLDERLNMEQLANTPIIIETDGVGNARTLSEEEFFEGAPSCYAAYQQNKSENARLSSKPQRLVTNPIKDDFDFEVNLGSNTQFAGKCKYGAFKYIDFVLVAKKKSDIIGSFSNSLSAKLGVKCKFKTAYNKIRVENGEVVEKLSEVGLEIGLETSIGGKISLKCFELPLPVIRVCIPTHIPTFTMGLMYQFSVGMQGNINAELGHKANASYMFKLNELEAGSNELNNESEANVVNKDKSPFYIQSENIKISELKFEGNVYIENKFMLVPVSANIMIPAAAQITPKFTFGTEIDFANKDLYKDNPEVTLSGDVKVECGLLEISNDGLGSIFQFLGLQMSGDANAKYEMPKFFFSKSKTFNPLSIDLFHVFPQVINPSVVRTKDSPIATLEYESSPFYLLSNPFTTVQSLQPSYIESFKVVNQDYINGNTDESNVIGFFKPEYTYHKEGTLRDFFKVEISGLVDDIKYYAIPVIKVFGLLTYEGEKILLRDSMLRLSIIGPVTHSFANIEQPQYKEYISVKYGLGGSISKIDNRMQDTEARYLYDSNSDLKELKYYEYDYYSESNVDGTESSIRYLDYCTKYYNISVDKKTGVLVSCSSQDYDYKTNSIDGNGRLKCYYDDKMHLSSIVSNDGVMSFNWDNDGRLLSVESDDGDGSTLSIEYTYAKEGKYPNTHGQWTPNLSLWGDFLAFSHLIGRAPSELPSKIKVTDICVYDGNTVIDTWENEIAYDYNHDGSVLVENVTETIYYRDENNTTQKEIYKWKVPYGYLNISISDEQLQRDQNLGITRSAFVSDSNHRKMRKVRSIFNKRRK